MWENIYNKTNKRKIMNTYKQLKDLIDYQTFLSIMPTNSRNVFLTDSEEIFGQISSLIAKSDKKIIGYHAINLLNAERFKISINRIEVFKQLKALSICEELARHIYANSEEIEKSNRKKNNLKNELEVFCSNYHPFDFYKFYEKRTENKISCSMLKHGIAQRETFNIGNFTLFLCENIYGVDISDNFGKNKRIDRKHNEDFANTFTYKDKDYIFEFSNKPQYKSIIEMTEY